MKIRNLLLVIGLYVSVTGLFAQINQPCTTPVSNTFFQQKLNQINTTLDADSRFNLARSLVQSNCLSSWQVKQVTLALADDQDKLEFCKVAYAKTTDQVNFYDVYDAFAYFSTVFRLHDYVNTQRMGSGGNPVVITNNTPTNELGFPMLPYPDYNQYLGATGCNAPMSEETFTTFAKEVKYSKMMEQAKADYVKNLINTQCLSTAQIMKLTSLLSLENLRLDVLKAGIPRVYDRGNYGYAQYVLNTQSFKNDFMNALFGQTTTTTTTTVQCTVTQAELDDIKKTIENTSFSSSKVTIAKQAIQAKKCFTVKQIKDILNLFPFDDNKLDIAKFAYDYCSDKSNYYQVNDAFSFTSSKDDLTRYVQSKQ